MSVKLEEVRELIACANLKTYCEAQERARISLSTHYASRMVDEIENLRAKLELITKSHRGEK